MILKNATLFDADFNLVQANLSIKGGKIDRIAPDIQEDDSIDLSGFTIAPGFVDIHIHGCAGADTCDGTREALHVMAKHLVQKGVTSFCPTTMTVSLDQLKSALMNVKDCMDNPPEGASICGVNMEGPYISAQRLGAQKEEYVRKPDWREFKRLYDECDHIIKLVDIAPECEGGRAFIEHTTTYCRVSLAHTMAAYEQAKQAFGYGITHATHLFNAMEGLHHRRPGAVGAVMEDACVTAELICDGFHIHPVVLQIACKVLGENRTVIVSDSMRAAGLADGISELGGQTVRVQNGQARLLDGTLAGSATNMQDEVKNLIRFGIPLRQVIKSATINPARVIGLDHKIGSIAVGKDADLVVLDEHYDIRMVFAKGQLQTNSI